MSLTCLGSETSLSPWSPDLQAQLGIVKKNPPVNGGISLVIPITWRLGKFSASRQVDAVGPATSRGMQ